MGMWNWRLKSKKQVQRWKTRSLINTRLFWLAFCSNNTVWDSQESSQLLWFQENSRSSCHQYWWSLFVHNTMAPTKLLQAQRAASKRMDRGDLALSFWDTGVIMGISVHGISWGHHGDNLSEITEITKQHENFGWDHLVWKWGIT